jgi:hypothetical protein
MGERFMKVLNHGWYYYENNKENVVSCKYCECVFQYGKEDVYHQKSLYPSIESNADGSVKVVRYIGSYVNCPECDNPNLLCSEALDPEGK